MLLLIFVFQVLETFSGIYLLLAHRNKCLNKYYLKRLIFFKCNKNSGKVNNNKHLQKGKCSNIHCMSEYILAFLISYMFHSNS